MCDIDPRTHYHNVPGAQLTPDEKEFIRALTMGIADTFEHPLTFHLGIFWGASMWCSRAASDDIELIGLDIDLRRDRTNPKDRIWDEAEMNAAFIEADSTTYWQQWDHPIHFLFIDGDHHYDIVSADIAGWVSFVVVGGAVAFHDYRPSDLNMQQFPELEGVRRAVDEYFKPGEWKRLQGPDSIVAFRRLK